MQSGELYAGSSPTQPWTAVCLAMRLGTRISGPLFFGFSDPVTQRAIASMYTKEEFIASNQGTSVPSAAPSQLELAVRVRNLKCDLQQNHFVFVQFVHFLM